MVNKLLAMLLIGSLLLAGVAVATAQTGGGYDLTWSSIDGGGGLSAGGSYSLHGVIGQPDAGVMSGGPYTLNGGFLAGAVSGNTKIYLPLIVR